MFDMGSAARVGAALLAAYASSLAVAAVVRYFRG